MLPPSTDLVWYYWAVRCPLPLLLALLLAASAAPARAEMTAEQKTAVDTALTALYRCDYDAAEKLFSDRLAASPGDPVYSLGYATALWWRVENDFAQPGSPEEKRFFEAIGRAIDDAKHAEKGDRKADALLYFGAAVGLKARREATQHRWLAAYFDGRKSYKSERKALELDPNLYDAYLGVGAFDYYTATLGKLVRVLAFSSGGDKAKGLAELRLAADRGEFSKTAAKLLLVGIHWTFEKDPHGAWTILEELSSTYHDSPLIDSMRLIGLYHLRDASGLRREAQALLDKSGAAAALYRPIDRAGALYFLGVADQLSRDYPRALEHYQAALKTVPEGQPFRAVIRLFMGETLDLLGRRDEAVDAYKLALKEPPLWGVPRYAKFLLKHPFTADKDPLPPRGAELGGAPAGEEGSGA